MIGLCTLGPFPYPVDPETKPVYLNFGEREGGPDRPRLVRALYISFPILFIPSLIPLMASDLALCSLSLDYLTISSSSLACLMRKLALSLECFLSLYAALIL